MKIDPRTFITLPCLIAADIDKTFLSKGCDDEKQEFFTHLAPELLKLATNGVNIAVVTGNSIKEISSRFLNYLIRYIKNNSDIKVLSKFHFFCNSGGVYFHFSEAELNQTKKGIVSKLMSDQKNPEQIIARFINRDYLEKTKISQKDIEKIKTILKDEWDHYTFDLKKNLKSYQREYNIINGDNNKTNCNTLQYDLGKALDDTNHVDIRFIDIETHGQTTVQITIKPVLSWKHALHPDKKFNNDKRCELINRIHRKFDEIGLTSYTASPGGNTSIDITKSRLDKSYAIGFLIDYLGIEGNKRKGEKYGSNVIYLGDEVISGGGNDFPVTKIDGVLVLAVNEIPEYVPFKSKVIIPNNFTGPKASARVLSELNNIIQAEIDIWSKSIFTDRFPQKNAIQLFKEDWFLKKINEKIKEIFKVKTSTEDIQVLYSLISLISRNDVSAKKLSNILVNEIDEIMEALDENEYERLYRLDSDSSSR
jgi:hydroxymethylpyrimidine pyrophosphatase-like HAD family hydrolase